MNTTPTSDASTLGEQHQRSGWTWAGYAAFGWGLLFAAISFYWGAGGTLGVDTVWGSATTVAAQSPALRIAVWATGVLKVLAAILAIALVADWGRRLPRRPLAVLGWSAAVVLTLYGGVNVLAEALTAAGVIRPTSVDWEPLLWHLYLWDMSFLIWGILFGLATCHPTYGKGQAGVSRYRSQSRRLVFRPSQPGHCARRN